MSRSESITIREVESSDLETFYEHQLDPAYGAFTFENGTLRLATEMNAKNGSFRGYVEPVFDHMGIFNPQHDTGNPLNTVWQALLGGLTEVVRNHPKDRFGTKVPFSGTFDNPAPEVMTTIFNAFRNAFVKAFEGKLQNEKVELPRVDPNKTNGKESSP